MGEQKTRIENLNTMFSEMPWTILLGILGIFSLIFFIVLLTIGPRKKSKRPTNRIRTEDLNTHKIHFLGTPGTTCYETMMPSRMLHRTSVFLKKVPRRLWCLYIEAFLVPSFRFEWGKYSMWNYRSPVRPVVEHGRKTKIKVHKNAIAKKASRVIYSTKRSSGASTGSQSSPRPQPHDHSLCKIVHINVAGMIFDTQIRTLNQFPKTLLGDPIRRARFYDKARDEYFLDRSSTCFESIIYYYQTGGVLRRPFNVGIDMFAEEIKFYDLGKAVLKQYRTDEGYVQEEEKHLPAHLLQRKLWLLFEYPDSSFQAKIVAIISVVAIIMSISTFCLETVSLFESPDEEDCSLCFNDPFYLVDSFCSFWFCFEFIIRLVTCPSKKEFLWSFSNLIDFIAVVPYFISLTSTRSTSDTQNFTLLRVVRLVRVMRILKLSRHNKGLKILGKTLKASFRELAILMFFLGICIILFSSAVYIAEKGEGSKFDSIPISFWWAVITMTTVGYGDFVPKTTLGKMFGSVCALSGVLTLALPVPVIVSNFNTFYHRERYQSQHLNLDETVFDSLQFTEQCPYLSATYGPDGSVLAEWGDPNRSSTVIEEKRATGSSLKPPSPTASHHKQSSKDRLSNLEHRRQSQSFSAKSLNRRSSHSQLDPRVSKPH